MKIKNVFFEIRLCKSLINTLKKIKSHFKRKIVYNVNQTNYSKRCLLIYIINPFVDRKLADRHQNLWQTKEIARIIGSFKYNVDVINYDDRVLELKYNYDLVFGLIPRDIDLYSTHMNAGCKRIAYLTSMNLAVTTANEQKRLCDLRIRRGVELTPRRGSSIVIDKIIEDFDGALYIGNEYNFHSYDCFKMPPSFRIINSGYVFNWVVDNSKRNPKNFLFFASSGQVHKGLDLLLEIFAQRLKGYTLYVCGCYEQEKDFCEEYHTELFETMNIQPMGFVNIESEKFKEISLRCAFVVMPSCAEGCAGSVLTAMSAGLIPIVSKECGFEDDEVINLPDCKIDTIYDYIVENSNKDRTWLDKLSKHSIDVVKTKYSRECFTKSIERALNAIID